MIFSLVDDDPGRAPLNASPLKRLAVVPAGCTASSPAEATARFSGSPISSQAASPDAANRMAAINAAWELIGEPAKRVAYDRERAPLATTPVQPAGGTDRTQPGSGECRLRRRRTDRDPSGVVVERRRHVFGFHAAGGDRLARLDLGAVDAGQRL